MALDQFDQPGVEDLHDAFRAQVIEGHLRGSREEYDMDKAVERMARKLFVLRWPSTTGPIVGDVSEALRAAYRLGVKDGRRSAGVPDVPIPHEIPDGWSTSNGG